MSSFDEAVRAALGQGGPRGAVAEQLLLLEALRAAQRPEDAPQVGRAVLERLEPGMTIASGVAGAIPAGLAGTGALMAGQGPEGAARATQGVQEALTYLPQTPGGQGRLQSVLDLLSVFEVPGQAAGQAALPLGPGAATVSQMVVDELADPTNLVAGAGALAGAGLGAVRRVGRGIMRDQSGRIVPRVGRGSIKSAEADAVRRALPQDTQLQTDAVELVRKARREHPTGPGMMEDPTTGEVLPEPGWKDFNITGAEVSDAGNVKLKYKAGISDGFDFNYNLRTGKQYTGAARERRVRQVAGELRDEVLRIKRSARGGNESAQRVMNALHWYRDVRAKLFDAFGGGAIAAGELEAAFSPNTRLGINHRFAMEVLQRFVKGDFDDQLTVLDEILQTGATPTEAQWASLVPRQANGQPYGMNGRNGMMAMLDAFRAQTVGQAPKMRNYGRNLLGLGNDPTIDLIAARTVQRLSGRKRVVPELNRVEGHTLGMVADKEGNVIPGKTVKTPGGSKTFPEGDPRRTQVVGTSDQYGFAADVFNEGLEQLRAADPEFADVLADDLQAMMWIREGDLWTHNRWMAGKDEADLGQLLDQQELSRVQAGVSAQQGDVAPSVEAVEAARAMLLDGMDDDPGIFMARAPDTQGRYFWGDEASFDAEYVLQGDAEGTLDHIVSNVARAAKENNQESAFVSKVIPLDMDAPIPANGRPGVEVYFDPRMTDEALQRMQDVLARYEDEIPGFTVIKDSLHRVEGSAVSQNPGGVAGIRFQWVPEFEDILEAGDFSELRLERLNSFMQLVDEATEVGGVIEARPYWYDTLVMEADDYDSFIQAGDDAAGVLRAGPGAADARDRGFGRPLSENVARSPGSAGAPSPGPAAAAGGGGATAQEALNAPNLLTIAKKKFGVTDDPDKAGWILPGGELLDFTNQSQIRNVDHRNVWRAYSEAGIELAPNEGKTFAAGDDPIIQRFTRETGAVRFHRAAMGAFEGEVHIEVGGPLTDQQVRAIANATEKGPLQLEYIEPGGEVVAEFEIPEGEITFKRLQRELQDVGLIQGSP